MAIRKHKFCCGCLPIFPGIFAIVFHGFIHSIFVFCLILTSYYQQKIDGINYAVVTGYIFLMLIGVPILWVVIFQQIRGIKTFGILFLFLSVYNIACAIAYFSLYVTFKANSLLDKVMFWRRGITWVDSAKLPFTIWHIFTGLHVIFTFLWLYYTYIILIYPAYIKVLESEEPSVPEIIILENRLGPLGQYRPPQGYPYSTNQPPMTDHRIQERRSDSHPKSVLD